VPNNHAMKQEKNQTNQELLQCLTDLVKCQKFNFQMDIWLVLVSMEDFLNANKLLHLLQPDLLSEQDKQMVDCLQHLISSPSGHINKFNFFVIVTNGHFFSLAENAINHAQSTNQKETK
jgi:hypothetical protein